jgi:hypothetical protein
MRVTKATCGYRRDADAGHVDADDVGVGGMLVVLGYCLCAQHDTLDHGRMITWMGGPHKPVVGEIDQGSVSSTVEVDSLSWAGELK